MEHNLSYTYEHKLKIKEHTLSRVHSSIEKFGTCTYSSTIENAPNDRSLRFTVLADLEGTLAKLDIEFRLNTDHIYETRISLYEKPKDINAYTLKFFAISLIQEIITNDHNEELKKYTIRTYSKYYCRHAITDSIVINIAPKFLIKPQPWSSREEPLSEQILMFDTEVDAVNIEHARNIAYNHTANVNAYLSVLLDCGFEMVNSEFRIFNIKNERGVLQSMRFRTGVVDEELGLLVKDNHYGLKDLYDQDQVDSYNSGKIALSFAGPREDGGVDHYSTAVLDNSSNNDFLDKTFSKHTLIPPAGSKDRVAPPHLSDAPDFLDTSERLPAETRKFFKAIASLDVKKKDAFLACCRLYNLALTVGRRHPTLAQSYKVCAVEALGLCEQQKFSEFMVAHSKPGFDKDLTDYFYSVRSKHFHAGQFLFDEYNIEFQRNIAFSFNAKNADFGNFSRYIRIAIINWVRINLLERT
jgi:hypothetical protein